MLYSVFYHDEMQNTPLVSLIIITYNSAQCLPALLESLAHTHYPGYEIIVVDNASADSSVQLVARHAPQARLLLNHENLGFGRACNQGAAAAQGDFFVFMNPDVQFTPAWLDALLACAAAAPKAALISPETLPLAFQSEGEGSFPPGYQDTKKARKRSFKLRDFVSAWHTKHSPLHSNQPRMYSERASLPGAALMMRREAWQRLGGFDERIFLYWEDTELCWRAWIMGWRVLVAHDSIVYHERGGSGGGAAWAVEAATNGLYTHLKLMRWRRIVMYMFVLLLKTLRQPALYQAWLRNLRGLGLTMTMRREILAQRVIDPGYLERLIDVHAAL